MARIEGPAEFHCLLHHLAGMQQVVAVEGLKTHRRHPQKHPRRLSKKKGSVLFEFILRHVKAAPYLFFAFKAVMQLLRQQAEGGRTILDAVTCTSAIAVTLAEKKVPKDHFEKHQF